MYTFTHDNSDGLINIVLILNSNVIGYQDYLSSLGVTRLQGFARIKSDGNVPKVILYRDAGDKKNGREFLPSTCRHPVDIKCSGNLNYNNFAASYTTIKMIANVTNNNI